MGLVTSPTPSDNASTLLISLTSTLMAARRKAFLKRDLKKVQGKYHDYAEKFALLVACSYHGQKGELVGCAKDLMHAFDFIQNDPMGIPRENITVLTDDTMAAKYCGSQGKPTMKNIKAGMKAMAKRSRSGTLQVFLYSGHGAQLDNEGADADEHGDGDQALCPIDINDTSLPDYGFIRDDWILKKFVLP